MGTETFKAEAIFMLLQEQTVATLPEIKAVLGTASEGTAHRKLADIGCRTSYSHSGRYYTLDELTDYDEHGLWSYEDIHFSAHGTLLITA